MKKILSQLSAQRYDNESCNAKESTSVYLLKQIRKSKLKTRKFPQNFLIRISGEGGEGFIYF